MSNLLAIAVDYGTHGLAVIPILPRTKQPAIRWGAFRWEPPAADEIEAMFSTSGEELNVGLVCGVPSQNLAVFDVETKSSFIEVVNRFDAAGIGDTWIVETPRGGHVYFRSPEPIKPTKKGPVEVRGQNQYVLAPPSIHPSGSQYSFVNRSPSICQIASLEAIDWLRLETAQPNDHLDLPRHAAQLLSGQGHYQSRSEME